MATTIMKGALGSATGSITQSLGLKGNSELDESGGIKWYNYNYPPYINVVHFDPANDPISMESKVVLKF